MMRKINSLLIQTGPKIQQYFVNTVATAANKAQLLQEAALEENCIVVDENDCSLGWSSKRDCHLVNKDGNIKLHRAFSVFLFNPQGDMLIQKRSSAKVYQKKKVLTTCKLINNIFF